MSTHLPFWKTQPIGVERDSLEALRASLGEAVQAALKSFHAYVEGAVSGGGVPQVSGALPGEPFPRGGFEPADGPARALDAGIKAQLDAALATAFAEEKRALVAATTTPFRVADPRTAAVEPGAGAPPGAPPIVPPVPMPVPPVGAPPVFHGGHPPAPEPSPTVAFNFAELFRANGQRHS